MSTFHAEEVFQACAGGDINKVQELIVHNSFQIDALDEQKSTALYIAASCGFADIVRLLITLKANINLASNHGMSPLYIATDKCHTEVVRVLVEAGAHLSTSLSRSYYQPPLCLAAYHGSAEIVCILLNAGVSTEVSSELHGESPLHNAARYGRTEVVALLIERNAKVDHLNKNGETPLLCALREGTISIEIVKLLVASNKNVVNMCTKNGTSPLHYAVQKQFLDIVKYLLSSGADVNAVAFAPTRNFCGKTALHYAVQHNHDVSIAEVLVHSGALVDTKDEDDATPLYIATTYLKTNMVRLLISVRANVNEICTGMGRTALSKAAENNSLDIVRLLLVCDSIYCNESDKDGSTPLHYSSSKGHTELTELLLCAGAKVNIWDAKHRTPLYFAAYCGHEHVVRALLAAGADFNFANHVNSAMTALHVAAANNRVSVVKLLVEQPGLDLNATDLTGCTALFSSSYFGHVEIVKILLDAGADANVCNKHGISPLYEAVKHNFKEIVELLVNAQAVVGAVDKKTQWTELHRAAHSNKHIVQLLLNNIGTNSKQNFLNSVDTDGKTALHIAVERGDESIVELLVSAKVSLDIPDKLNLTCLHKAVAILNICIARHLVFGGANLNLLDRNGNTALNLCANSNAPGAIAIATLLITAGANINKPDKDNRTPLFKACSHGHLLVAVALIQAGANLNTTTNFMFIANLKPLLIADPHRKRLLHLACEQHTIISLNQFSSILKACPEAAKLRDGANKIPIELAISNNAPLSFIAVLLEKVSHSESEIKSIPNIAFAAASDYYSRLDVMFLREVLYNNLKVYTTHIHICGDSRVGKSTITAALRYTLACRNFLDPGYRQMPPLVSHNIKSTVGMSLHAVEYGDRRYIIHDYGGQDEFHVNHSRFLAAPGSIYIIVVPLWKIDDEKTAVQTEVMTDKMVEQRYTYWLNFVNSIVDKSNNANVITVINKMPHNTGGCTAAENANHANRIKFMIEETQKNWCEIAFDQSEYLRLQFPSRPVVLDPNNTREILIDTNFNNILLDAIANSVIPKPLLMCTCVANVLKEKKKGNWPAVLLYDDFKTRMMDVLLAKQPNKERFSEERLALLKNILFSLIVKRLESINELLVFTAADEQNVVDKTPISTADNNLLSEATINRDSLGSVSSVASDTPTPAPTVQQPLYAITNLNWLTEKLLGAIAFNMRARKKNDETEYYLFTEEDIYTIAHNAADGIQLFKDEKFVSMLPNLLVSMGACVVVTVNRDRNIKKLWFPVHFANANESLTAISLSDFQLESVTENGTVLKYNRLIVRRFQLADKSRTMFPPGYFMNLFSEVKSVFLEVADMQLKHNAMALSYNTLHRECKVKAQIIIARDKEKSFVVRVLSVVTEAASGASAATVDSYAYFVLQKIVNILTPSKASRMADHNSSSIRHDEMFINHNVLKVSSVQSWLPNVSLTEYYLHPLHNVKDGNKFTVDEVIERLEDINERIVESVIPFYYGISGASDKIVDSNDVIIALKDSETLILSKLNQISKFLWSFRDETLSSFVTVADSLLNGNCNYVSTAMIDQMKFSSDTLAKSIDKMLAVNDVSTSASDLKVMFADTLKTSFEDYALKAIKESNDLSIQYVEATTTQIQAQLKADFDSFKDSLANNSSKQQHEDVSKLKSDLIDEMEQLKTELQSVSANMAFIVQNNKDMAAASAEAQCNFHNELFLTKSTLLQHINNGNAEMRGCSEMLQNILSNTETQLQNVFGVPSLVMLAPVDKKAYKMSDMFNHTYMLHFVCGHTFQLAVCGPNNKGYKIQVKRKWVKQAVPVLRMALIVTKIILTVAGLPIPIPQIEYMQDAVNATQQLVDSVEPTVEALETTTVSDRIVSTVATAVTVKKTNHRSVYESVKNLLHDNDPNLSFTGLRFVTHAGKSDWIWDSDEVEKSYREDIDRRVTAKNNLQVVVSEEAWAAIERDRQECQDEESRKERKGMFGRKK